MSGGSNRITGLPKEVKLNSGADETGNKAPTPITQEDCVCKGNGGVAEYECSTYRDCSGGCVPEKGMSQELLDIVNQFQLKIGRKIIATSGYRCDEHNAYSWAVMAAEYGDEKSVLKYNSKHAKGDALDFVIVGATTKEEIYGYAAKLKEMFGGRVKVKVYGADEGRDPDNKDHLLPYIHLNLVGDPPSQTEASNSILPLFLSQFRNGVPRGSTPSMCGPRGSRRISEKFLLKTLWSGLKKTSA